MEEVDYKHQITLQYITSPMEAGKTMQMLDDNFPGPIATMTALGFILREKRRGKEGVGDQDSDKYFPFKP
jgi:hypothetical protein